MADLQKKYPQVFEIEGTYKDVTGAKNNERTRGELLEHDTKKPTEEVLRNED